MKKLSALLLVAAIALCLCIPAFAVRSPSANSVFSVQFFGVDNVKDGARQNVKHGAKNNKVTINADPDKGTFDNWSIYIITTDSEGNRKYKDATISYDYELIINDPNITEADIEAKINEFLKKKNLTVLPKSDIIICGNYNGKFTSPLDGKQYNTKEEIFKLTPPADKNDSPKTGDNASLLFLFALLSFAGLTVCTKKVLSK